MKRLSYPLIPLVLVACAHTGAVVKGTTDSASLDHTRQLVAEVSQIRGLPEKQPVQIDVEGGDTFKGLVEKNVDDDLTSDDINEEMARWVAFGFVPANMDLKKMLEQVYGDETAGFYSPKSKTLHVPVHTPSLQDDMILAHEIEHSLQDQNFGITDLHDADDDTQLAASALFEGDATFVMMDWALRHNPRTPPGTTADALVSVARELQAAPTDVLIGLTGKSKSLAAAPPIIRESLLFPYFAGLRFVAEMYHRGGYPLVNEVFHHRPVSTRQLLHPEAYLAGEKPTPINDTPLPPGETVAARGHLGELAIRTMLADCVGRAQADKAADGWSGDTFLVTHRPDHSLALYWTTVWKTIPDAAVFTLAMNSLAACWKTTAGLPGQAITPEAVVDEHGSVVAVVRGLPKAEEWTAVAKLFPLVLATPPPQPPISTATLASLPPPARSVNHDSGHVENGIWINDWYGLRASIPPGFNTSIQTPGVLFQALRRDPDLVGYTLGVIATTDSTNSRETTFKAFHDTVASMLGHSVKITPVADTAPTFGKTTAVRRQWEISGRFAGISATAIPICNGRAYVLVGQFWQGKQDMPLVDSWLRTVSVSPGPFCDSLAPATATQDTTQE